MDVRLCLEEFEKLAQKLGIEVRSITGGPSGLCTVHGERILFIDRTLDNRSQVEVFIREFKILNLNNVFVVPIIRKLIGLDDETTDE